MRVKAMQSDGHCEDVKGGSSYLSIKVIGYGPGTANLYWLLSVCLAIQFLRQFYEADTTATISQFSKLAAVSNLLEATAGEW